MYRILTILLFLSATAFAVPIDSSAAKFEMRDKRRVDVFDFSEEFSNLENIDIDARRKKNVEFYLTGNFPLLKTLTYEGSFGVLKGELTGHFPELSQVTFWCTSCAMDFDLRGDWQRDCQINIRGLKENVTLVLPANVGLVVHAKVSPKGKIRAEGLKKKGWWHVWKKTYTNALAETAPVVLTLNIETTDGHITLLEASD